MDCDVDLARFREPIDRVGSTDAGASSLVAFSPSPPPSPPPPKPPPLVHSFCCELRAGGTSLRDGDTVAQLHKEAKADSRLETAHCTGPVSRSSRPDQRANWEYMRATHVLPKQRHLRPSHE
eukprot:5371333-Prymnesium_polylepis.2